jgi:hypothetical protein
MQEHRRTSLVWTLSRPEFVALVEESLSLKDLLTKLGHNSITGMSYGRMMRRIHRDNIDLTELRKRSETHRLAKIKSILQGLRRKDADIFCENSDYTKIRKRVKSRNLLPYSCAVCGCKAFHNNLPLVLHMDHINGHRTDNRLENLRWLCPNCHSQTDTYTGKNRRKAKPECEKCGGPRSAGSRSKCCVKCYDPGRKIQWPDPDELRQLLTTTPTSKVAKKLGVSDVAVSKFCKKHKIKKPARGYWRKQESANKQSP